MINKTFRGGRSYKGAKATIEYLLNERVEEGNSRVLRGDSELTHSVIYNESSQQNVCKARVLGVFLKNW